MCKLHLNGELRAVAVSHVTVISRHARLGVWWNLQLGIPEAKLTISKRLGQGSIFQLRVDRVDLRVPNRVSHSLLIRVRGVSES